MKEKLIAYFNRQMLNMEINPTERRTYFNHAFGALEFACMTLNNWDKESELIDLWNEKWKPKFEAKVYGEI